MQLRACQMEIDERSYLLGSILLHVSNTYRIKLKTFSAVSEDGSNYFIQCGYLREYNPGVFSETVEFEKLNIILFYYQYS